MSRENTERVLQHIRFVSEPLAEPGHLRLEIDIQHRKAAIYCDISTPPHEVEQLAEAHADELAARLDAWGID